MRIAPLDTCRRRRLTGALVAVLATAGVAAVPAAADVGRVVGPTVAVPPPAATTAAPPAPARVVHPVAHAAGTSAVTIRDFSFGPSAITVHVGDTVTWSNAGPTAHTATGAGFDTGILGKGRSGSHTFTTAGTFAYHCTLHPFMHGTVVVVATTAAPHATAPAAPTGSAAQPATTTPATSAPPAAAPATGGASPTAAQALPNTGLDAAAVAALGALSFLCGLGLRRATRPRTARTSRARRGF